MDALPKVIDSFAYKSSLMQLGDAMISQFLQESGEEAKENKLGGKGRHVNSNESDEDM